MTNENSGKKIKLLLAEDDKFISRAYVDGLTRAGIDVVLASDGEEAIKKINAEKPDIILLDVIMPEKNGFEVLQSIKAVDGLKSIPVVILSNLGQESDIQKGKELGADDYLIKSNFSIKEVVEKIQSILAVKNA